MSSITQTIITDSIDLALRQLHLNQCVAIPTETVYGLAANACSDEAVQRIYTAKGRPSFNPLIIHVDSMAMARQWGLFTDEAETLAAAFWGEAPKNQSPLTLIVKSINPALSRFVQAGLDTVGIRLPGHSIARSLISAFGKPLAAPSANRSNYISPTSAEAVFNDLNGRIPLILDGGPCIVGLESTIVDVSGATPTLLRHGGTSLESLRAVVLDLENKVESDSAPIIKAPGMLKRHYAPNRSVRLNAESLLPGEAFLGFGAVPNATLNLSPSGNLDEAANNLFAMLRQLDMPMYTGIAISPIPMHGLGIAINDRLKRASTK